MYCYRPQRSCGQGNIFAPVCHSVHRGGVCLSACLSAPGSRHPPGADSPREQTPGQTPPGSRHPPRSRPPEQTPPRSRHPPREADSGIRSMSGRYASYWNAFLFYLLIYWSRFTSIVKSPAFNGSSFGTVHVRFHYM